MSGGEDGLVELHKENPFLNPVVLQTLFEVCKPIATDIAQYRLVSKEWQSASLKLWRSNATMTIRRNYCHEFSSPWRGEIMLEDFLKLASSSKPAGDGRECLASKPFTSFRLIRWSFKDPTESSMYPPQFQFLSTVGPWIKTLFLDHCSFKTKYFIKVLLRDTPNLKELRLDFPLFEDRISKHPVNWEVYSPQRNLKSLHFTEYDGAYTFQWEDIFTGFPNLETFIVDGHTAAACHDEFPLIAVLGAMSSSAMEMEKKEQRRGLRHVDFLYIEGWDRTISPRTVDAFRQAGMPLETLKIDLAERSKEVDIRKLLQLYSATLQTLHCRRSRCKTRYKDFLGSCSFEHLKELTLFGDVSRNFSFLRHTPNLETLHLDHYSPEVVARQRATGKSSLPVWDTKFRATSGSRADKLTEFRTDIVFENGDDAFLRVAKWMPNLTRLSAPLNAASFPVVCTTWKGTLKELHITKEGKIGDEELTGIPPPTCSTTTEPPTTGHHRPANISDLKELEKFSQDEGKHYYSSHSVTHGFLILPKLASLRIFVEPELPPNQLAILRKRILHLDVSLRARDQFAIRY